MALAALDSESFKSGQSTPRISRCTAAMNRFVSRIPEPDNTEIDTTAVYALINMVQGRVLEYLAERICRSYGIYDSEAAEKISIQLSSIFSDEFFALFREKIDRTPNLVLHLAQRIIGKECGTEDAGPSSQDRVDRMYSAIFRKYFEYRHLGALLGIVAADSRIQRTIVQSMTRNKISDEALRGIIDETLAHDPHGIFPGMILEYLRSGRIQELAQAIGSADWIAAASRQGERLAHLRGE